MKRVLILSIFFCLSICTFSQNHEFKISWTYGLAGGSKPTTSMLTSDDAISEKKAQEVIKIFLESSKLDFKCIYNGCQNRASVMSFYLQKQGIKHYKVWNFDPFKISIFNAQDALNVEDPLKLRTGKIYWDFHVAITVLVKSNADKKIDTMVIDPAFSVHPLKVSEWLALQNSPNSYYTFLDPLWYNYVTLQPGLLWNCNKMTDTIKIPNCFPFLLTGDFYKYGGFNEPFVIAELATNEQITKAANEIIYKLNPSDPLRNQLSVVVSDYNGFKDLLQGNIQPTTDNPFKKYLETYKISYNNSVLYWTKELKNLQ